MTDPSIPPTEVAEVVARMNAAPEAWTREPYELYVETRWQIYDPNLAIVVAEFGNEEDARNYLQVRNIDRPGM